MKSSKNNFVVWPVIILILAAAGYFVFNYFSKLVSIPEIGEAFPIEGAAHVAEGTKVEYRTNPPSSGAHYAKSARWGVYDNALSDGNLVHNLEHGGVWISYRPSISADEIKKLKDLVRSYKSKVILTPREKNDSSIALVSWGRIHKIDSFNGEIIKNFILKYKNTGPELVPD
ncbi:MAG: DUF3105 domain-containing protein [Candidatus Giovannonibacteria bacterium]|nr:MAG: DUF3105 domain-containing protein [Candidatus Giovannonibacteria bacterium]